MLSPIVDWHHVATCLEVGGAENGPQTSSGSKSNDCLGNWEADWRSRHGVFPVATACGCCEDVHNCLASQDDVQEVVDEWLGQGTTPIRKLSALSCGFTPWERSFSDGDRIAA